MYNVMYVFIYVCCSTDILLGKLECYQPHQCRQLFQKEIHSFLYIADMHNVFVYVHLSGRLSVCQDSSLRVLVLSNFSSLLTNRKAFKCSYLSVSTTNPGKWHVRPAMSQISLTVRIVWSEWLLSIWRHFVSLAFLVKRIAKTLIRRCICLIPVHLVYILFKTCTQTLPGYSWPWPLSSTYTKAGLTLPSDGRFCMCVLSARVLWKRTSVNSVDSVLNESGGKTSSCKMK